MTEIDGLAAAKPGIARAPRSRERTRDLIVIVDDDALLLRGLERALSGSFDVIACHSARAAIERVRQGGVSVVLSDISMPEMSGLELSLVVRELEPDLPVVLITGEPTLESATKAIEHGVFRYLVKPFQGDQLTVLVAQASQLHRLARLRRDALEFRQASLLPSLDIADGTFADVLDALWVVFQPIVSVSRREVFGYEALMRSSDPAFRSPSLLLEGAERLNALDHLGRVVRERAVSGLANASGSPLLFVNLHPHDLADPELLDPDSPLATIAPRVVLEITERASLGGIDGVQARVAALRELGFRIAIDDLGAGYAGLTSFALLEPEIVKLDMTLTRNVDKSSVKQKLVASLSSLCREMGMIIVVEGVETIEERDALVSLGCDLLQGHLFALPEKVPPTPRW